MGQPGHRFCFFGKPKDSTEVWEITGDEFNHLSKVLKLKLGTAVEVMDGVRNSLFTGTIQDIQRGCCVVSVCEEKIVQLPGIVSTLLLGALDHREVDKIIPSLVELGLGKLVVFLDEGLQKDRLSPTKLCRWNEIAKDAQKQCKRTHSLDIDLTPNLKDYLNLQKNSFTETNCLVFSSEVELEYSPEENGNRDSVRFPRQSLQKDGDSAVYGCVGPEKGLSLSLYKCLIQEFGFMPRSLGTYTLRATTAAVAATVVLNETRKPA